MEQRIDSLWSHVHALGVLQDAGSFTAAAQRLGMSKASMSQRVAELERAAGVPLVRRTTRSVRLTEAGERLVEATRGAYAAIEEGFAGVRDSGGEPHGLLRVSAPVALGRQQIVPRLAGFLRAHPRLRVELELSDRLVALAQEGFDVALRHTAAPPDTHVAWPLCATRSCLAATRGYLRRAGVPRAPQDLAQHECLHYTRPGETATWSFEPDTVHERGAATGRGTSTPRAAPEGRPLDPASARVSVPVRGAFAANNSEALREAALAGLGIALLPDFTAQAALHAGKLVRVLPAWRPVGTFGEHVYAIRPYTPVVPRAVQAFVAYWRAALAEGFPIDPPGKKRTHREGGLQVLRAKDVVGTGGVRGTR
ncbi:MAG TPA: LysR family transcriptional regulator [Burkholderiaceae bacterium]|nr:LysR family transcriptional regulator [Burkholderiaceae bacterium]